MNVDGRPILDVAVFRGGEGEWWKPAGAELVEVCLRDGSPDGEAGAASVIVISAAVLGDVVPVRAEFGGGDDAKHGYAIVTTYGPAPLLSWRGITARIRRLARLPWVKR